jgi:hypothetical protein
MVRITFGNPVWERSLHRDQDSRFGTDDFWSSGATMCAEIHSGDAL